VKAAVLHAPGDLRIESVPSPAAGPGEVVLDIGAALSCGTDVKSVARGHPSIASYPSRLGHEFAGVVAAVGDGAASVAAGDRVFCGDSAPCGVCRACLRGRESLCEDLLYLLGGFAEQVLVPARIVERNLHRVPDGLDLRVAALAEPLGCVVHALDATAAALAAEGPASAGATAGSPSAAATAAIGGAPSGPSPTGATAVVLGAGSLGLMHCALLTSAGARVTVLDPHPERLAVAERFGAAETVVAERGPADVARVGGADLVVEAVGRPEAWELAVAMAARGGTVNLFGGCARDSTFTVPTARVHYDQVTLTGTYHHAPRYLARALEVLAAGEWPWAELLGPEIGLDALPDALAGRLHDPPPAKYTVLPAAGGGSRLA
jgi:L-iditol 2-dehydrogenase